MVRGADAPVNLEFDLGSGGAASAIRSVEALLCELTGAEAATVVNNNAAAVLLMLSALANRREVIVSRGELVEIGGSFRMPGHHAPGRRAARRGGHHQPHAPRRLCGGHRRAHRAADEGAHQQLRHQRLHRERAGRELAQLARAHGVPLAVDLGSGTLVDLSRWRLPAEPTVREVVAAGADLVAFSGDKLLGGPQAGMIVGRCRSDRQAQEESAEARAARRQADARRARGGARRCIARRSGSPSG